MSALPIVACLPAPTDDAGFGCLRTERGALPLALFTADLAVAGPVWRWDIRQQFVNTGKDAIAAVYIFPLPPRGAVSSFRLRVAGREVVGQLQERAQARAGYQRALAEGRRAALLEEDRPDVFTVQVGNILPGERAEVAITLTGPVAIDDGVATVRLPLVVAPRYIPGEVLGDDVGDGTAADTDQVPDASRITAPVLLPGFRSPVRLGITLAIAGAEGEVTGLGCTLPTVGEGSGGGVRRWRVAPGQRLDRDCVVRWKVGSAALSAVAWCAPGAPDGGCTVALSVLPPVRGAVTEVSEAAAGGPITLDQIGPARPGPGPGRDVVVLLDRSGSMSGWKMVAARRAAAGLVDSLSPRDRFAALAFDDRVDAHVGAPALHQADERARCAAVTWLGALESRGGTEMDGAFATAFALLDEDGGERERVLVLVTDGQVGNEDQLLKTHARALARVRVVALGVDQAVNESLLQRLAKPNGGWVACVESEEWLDQVLGAALRAVQPAALAGIAVTSGGEGLPAVTPDPVPDAWPNRPLTVWARVPSPAPSTVTVSGTTADGKPWSATVPVVALAEPALHAAWARGRIRDLEDRHAIRADAEVAAEIVRVSLAENVLSRFTAFLAVDREIAADGTPRTVVQAVETPAGWGLAEAAAAGGPGSPPTGAFHGLATRRRSMPAKAKMAAAAPSEPMELDDLMAGGQALGLPSAAMGAGAAPPPMAAPASPASPAPAAAAGGPALGAAQPPSMSKRGGLGFGFNPGKGANSRRVVAAKPSPVDAAAIARALRDELQALAGDGLRLALALRSRRIQERLEVLAGALAGAVKQRLEAVRARIAPPANIAGVAGVWPELLAVLEEVAAGAGATPGGKRSGWKFWQ